MTTQYLMRKRLTRTMVHIYCTISYLRSISVHNLLQFFYYFLSTGPDNVQNRKNIPYSLIPLAQINPDKNTKNMGVINVKIKNFNKSYFKLKILKILLCLCFFFFPSFLKNCAGGQLITEQNVKGAGCQIIISPRAVFVWFTADRVLSLESL